MSIAYTVRPSVIAVRLLLAVLLIVASRSPARGSDDGTVEVAQTVHVAPELQSLADRLREQSPTFKQQWDRLSREPRLYVRVRLDATIGESPYCARTTIRRTIDGAFVAFVNIRAFGDPTEWLAHELEHIIEQLDGLNLGRLARLGGEGVWRAADGVFETRRALRAGRRVVDEARTDAQLAARAARAHPDRTNGDRPTSLFMDRRGETDLSDAGSSLASRPR